MIDTYPLKDTYPLNLQVMQKYISNALSSLHTQMVGKVNCLMYLTLLQHKCSNFQIPNYCHYYNPNGGTKICYLLMAGHADGIFVDGWMCQVQFRSCGSNIGHMIPIAVM